MTAVATADPVVAVRGLEKSYGDLHVLRGVDLEIKGGSIFALLGSNGAGKTTLVRILATLLRADAGDVEIAGADVASDPAGVRAAISLTGQFAVADRLLARFSLTEAGRRTAGEYSGGMRRRLDIAMSLVGEPRVVFLDEPTTGLDPEARLEVWQTVRELAATGVTVLLTTQYLDEAEHLADRIAILHEGRILVEGTLADLTALLPPARVEYIKKQPSLEDVFLSLTARTTENEA